MAHRRWFFFWLSTLFELLLAFCLFWKYTHTTWLFGAMRKHEIEVEYLQFSGIESRLVWLNEGKGNLYKYFIWKKWIEATATYNWRFSWVFGDNGTKVASIRQQKSNKEHFAYQRFQIDSCFCKHIVAMSHKWNVKQKPKVYLVDDIWQTRWSEEVRFIVNEETKEQESNRPNVLG